MNSFETDSSLDKLSKLKPSLLPPGNKIELQNSGQEDTYLNWHQSFRNDSAIKENPFKNPSRENRLKKL